MADDLLNTVIAPSIFCIICMIGLLGNGLVLYIMTAVVKTKSVTDVYVTNLAVADFLFLATLPFWAAELFTSNWVFGVAMCKILSSVSYINMYASIYFLTAMGVDRWLAVVKAVKSRKIRVVRKVWIICSIIWFVCLVLSIFPLSFRTIRQRSDGSERCAWKFPNGYIFTLHTAYTVSRVSFGFVIPLTVITFCYCNIVTFMRQRSKAKGKKFKGLDKITKMVYVIITCFVLAWLPNQTTNMMQLMNSIFHFCNPSSTGKVDNSTITATDSFLNTTSEYTTTYADSTAEQDGPEFVTANWRDSTAPSLGNPISGFIIFNQTTTIAGSVTHVTKQITKTNSWCFRKMQQFHMVTVCLGFANSLMNPLVYAFVGSALRKKIKLVFSTRKPLRFGYCCTTNCREKNCHGARFKLRNMKRINSEMQERSFNRTTAGTTLTTKLFGVKSPNSAGAIAIEDTSPRTAIRNMAKSIQSDNIKNSVKYHDKCVKATSDSKEDNYLLNDDEHQQWDKDNTGIHNSSIGLYGGVWAG